MTEECKSYLANFCICRDKGVCTQKVYVGFPPDLPVVNFQCVSSDWADLNCTWEEPYNPVPTHYNVTLISGRGSYVTNRQCPEPEGVARPLARGVHQCYLSILTEPHYRQSARTYYFYFNATNPLRPTGRISSKTVNNFQVVKPGPPVVTVTSQTGQSIDVEWDISRGMVHFPPGLRQSLQFKCEWDEDWKVVDTSHLDITAEHFSLTLSDSTSLTPFTECNISVWMSNPGSMPLLSSEPVFVLGKTRPAPPLRAPNTTIAGFETLELGEDSRAIIVYWQRLSRREQYGPDFEYVVREITGDVLPTEVRTSHARFESLSGSPQSFSIFSKNSEGSSSQYSVVNVPASQNMTDLQPRSVTKVYRADEELFVSWLAPSSPLKVTNYTVLWCRADSGRDTPHQCDGDIQWTTAPPRLTSMSLPLVTAGVHQVAVAANYEGLSSGLQWTTCTISNRAGTVTRVTDIAVGEGQMASSQIKVRWSLYCSKMGNIVNNFLVSVCEGGDCRSIKAPAGEEEVEVSGLSPYTTYTATVSVLEADSQRPGRPSPPATFTTAPAPPSSPVYNINSSVTDNRVELTWGPPVRLNGELCKYDISVDQSQVQSVTENRVVLVNMTSFTTYEVRLAACVRSRSGRCVLCGQSVLTRVTTDIGQPAAPSTPSVRPVNMSAVSLSWDTRFHLGAPSVQDWRLEISTGEDRRETLLTVDGPSLDLTVDIESLEESNACHQAGIINKFFYVRLQAVVRDDSTGQEFFSPWSSRQEILVPCYQNPPVLLYIFICLVSSLQLSKYPSILLYLFRL